MYLITFCVLCVTFQLTLTVCVHILQVKRSFYIITWENEPNEFSFGIGCRTSEVLFTVFKSDYGG